MTIPAIVTAQTQVDPRSGSARRTPLCVANADGTSRRSSPKLPSWTAGAEHACSLPSLRVHAVIRVLNDGEDVTARVRYSRRAGILTLPTRWSTDVGSIEVTLEHGHPIEDVPDVAALIVTLTKRAAASGATIAQQNLGPAGVRYALGTDGAPLSLPLLASEKATLGPYALAGEP
ncbi:hypothetical protein JM654_03880 [Microbacterium oxydans]|nr:hypothetical protein [Microbacterium oxydans]